MNNEGWMNESVRFGRPATVESILTTTTTKKTLLMFLLEKQFSTGLVHVTSGH